MEVVPLFLRWIAVIFDFEELAFDQRGDESLRLFRRQKISDFNEILSQIIRRQQPMPMA